jgi:hypothetical protein
MIYSIIDIIEELYGEVPWHKFSTELHNKVWNLLLYTRKHHYGSVAL